MKEIIVHVSDSEFGNAVLIDKWHRWKKFKKIGYHYIILNGRPHSSAVYDSLFDGAIETGRPRWKKGAHCKRHNNSIGICLVNKSGQFTRKQKEALIVLITELKKEYTDIKISQHSDYDKKKPHCAGMDLQQIRGKLLP